LHPSSSATYSIKFYNFYNMQQKQTLVVTDGQITLRVACQDSTCEPMELHITSPRANRFLCIAQC